MKEIETHKFNYPNGNPCVARVMSPSGTMNHPVFVSFQSPNGEELFMGLKEYNAAIQEFWGQGAGTGGLESG